MAEAKHTKGPWAKGERLNGPWWHISASHTVGGERCRGGSQAIASVHGESRRGAQAYAEMFEANAYLIAAAPELLEALQHAVHWFDQLKPEDIARYRIAIAKATNKDNDHAS